jgi:hypothetical protein
MVLTLSRRRHLLFAVATLLGTAGALMSLLLVADVYAHKKYERTALVNIWGYRGPTVGRKAPGEVRVAVLGGSTAFGYGRAWDASMPYLLEQRLNAAAKGRFSVVNLAFNNEGAFAVRFTLEDYAWLDYDLAIVYEGYNDLGDEPHYHVFRHRSAVFRLTGYLPILPLVLNEKAFSLLHGNVARGYDGSKTTFRPGVVEQTTARAIETAAAAARSLEDQLGKLTKDPAAALAVTRADDCQPRWQHYCGAILDAVAYARSRGKGVLVGTQPFVSDAHVEQQEALTAFLRQRFGSDPRVRHVNLGSAIDLAARRDIAYDGLHLTAEGNDIIARHFVEPVLDMTARLSRTTH